MKQQSPQTRHATGRTRSPAGRVSLERRTYASRTRGPCEAWLHHMHRWLQWTLPLAAMLIAGCGRDPSGTHPDAGTAGGVYRFSEIPETVLVPAGEFVMGDDLGDPSERPRRIVATAAFRIGKFPVTNEQYAVFTAATGYRAPRYAKDARCNRPRQAVVGVNVRDAHAYCTWLSSVTGRRWRLPTEVEWEKAVRGTDGRRYP